MTARRPIRSGACVRHAIREERLMYEERWHQPMCHHPHRRRGSVTRCVHSSCEVTPHCFDADSVDYQFTTTAIEDAGSLLGLVVKKPATLVRCSLQVIDVKKQARGHAV
ncbi:hypothetical protein VPH35_008691 [Triticum aestivum]|uniref:uncharacterized protein n=1 Tax=Triticum aestivum TaxID=4565 RepID=UPI001D016B04|nr:uncharacterized protein LOC123127272 [Triticum aestivum]